MRCLSWRGCPGWAKHWFMRNWRWKSLTKWLSLKAYVHRGSTLNVPLVLMLIFQHSYVTWEFHKEKWNPSPSHSLVAQVRLDGQPFPVYHPSPPLSTSFIDYWRYITIYSTSLCTVNWRPSLLSLFEVCTDWFWHDLRLIVLKLYSLLWNFYNLIKFQEKKALIWAL